MKKLSIIFLAVMIAAIAGCAGDTTEPGGTLATVQDLQLSDTSTGRTIVLVWSAVTGDIDGYKIYFDADNTGTWVEVGESTTTTYTHTATNAGTYSVRAYKGTDYSENYSNEASTMPLIFNGTYTIYDQYSAADKPSGFIFLENGVYGITGLAGDPNFHQDIIAYDDAKGDLTVALYSGDSHYQGGNPSSFQVPASGAYGYCEPSGNWYISKEVLSGDSVLFVKMVWTGGIAYAKMYGITKAEDSTNNGTSVSFSFEYQPYDLGLTVFTSNAN